MFVSITSSFHDSDTSRGALFTCGSELVSPLLKVSPLELQVTGWQEAARIQNAFVGLCYLCTAFPPYRVGAHSPCRHFLCLELNP